MTTARQRLSVELGRQGEELAAEFLSELGMIVMARNWRCDIGELDIVARDGECLVVCEVKTRSSAAFGNPVETVTGRKVKRMRRLALRWLEEHSIHAREIRFDIVGVLRMPGGSMAIQHVRGVD